MAGDYGIAPPSFPTLRFLEALKAARDFGLDPQVANAIAARFDPRIHDLDGIFDALAMAVLIQGAVTVPDAV